MDEIQTTGSFPARLSRAKPADRPISAATARLYDLWNTTRDRTNPFYTTFRYSPVTGIGRDDRVSVSRRDPSKVLKIGDRYHVWYTRRVTRVPPLGMDRHEEADEETPAVDWDLADICHATSSNGFDWQEEGVAVPRAPRGSYGDRSLSTPDVLAWKGKFWLYYQCFTRRWRAHDCVSVSAAWSDSPWGPWTRVDRPVVMRGGPDEWDGCAIHDPYPLVYKGQIWLYYKGTPVDRPAENLRIAQGVAIADHPAGPFVKSPLNPVTNSGHETMLWPWRGGIATLLSLDGPEKNTVQYAEDGLNFVPKALVTTPPQAPGPFCPDAFADNGEGQGVRWGLAHINPEGGGPDNGCYIIRFDCNLCDAERPEYQSSNLRYHEDTWTQRVLALSPAAKARILAEQAETDGCTILGP